jgi:hypothetical protein
MCGVWSSDSLSKDEAHLKVFFDGFKIRSDEELGKADAKKLGYKIGGTLAIITMLSILVALGLGIVFIIKKVVYRKNKGYR